MRRLETLIPHVHGHARQSLLQRHQVLTETMDPINSPLIAETIRKLKTALQLFQTFVPPEMGDVIEQARLEQSHYYENQRVASLPSPEWWRIHFHAK